RWRAERAWGAEARQLRSRRARRTECRGSENDVECAWIGRTYEASPRGCRESNRVHRRDAEDAEKIFTTGDTLRLPPRLRSGLRQKQGRLRGTEGTAYFLRRLLGAFLRTALLFGAFATTRS